MNRRSIHKALVVLVASLGLSGCVTLDRPGADALTKQDDELVCRQLAALRAGPEGGFLRETILQGELKKCLDKRGWVAQR
jgi:hypothetical protein